MRLFIHIHLVVEYRGITPDVEREIFQRVQLGVALTSAGVLVSLFADFSTIYSCGLAEKLAAISSPYADFINELDGKFVSGCDDGINTLIRWNIGRGNHFRCLTQVAYCIERLPLGENTSVASVIKLGAWLRQQDPPGQQFRDEVDKVLSRFWALASANEYNKVFTSSKNVVAPVEFTYFSKHSSRCRQRTCEDNCISVDVLIAVLFKCPDSVIAEELHDMRVTVRKHAGSNNMRTKDTVIDAFWEFIHQAEDRHGIRRNKRPIDSDEFHPLLAQESRATGRKRPKKT